jgi:hypothetical protein
MVTETEKEHRWPITPLCSRRIVFSAHRCTKKKKKEKKEERKKKKKKKQHKKKQHKKKQMHTMRDE